jgi:small-conductance mechanosensitive channel
MPAPLADAANPPLPDSIRLPAADQETVTDRVLVRVDTLPMTSPAAEIVSAARLRVEVSELTAAVRALTRSHDSLRAQLSEDSAASAVQIRRSDLRNYGLRSVAAIILLGLAFFAIKGVVSVLNTLSERSARRRLLYKRAVPIVRIFIWAAVGFLLIRVVFGVDAQGVLTAAAAVGIAIGFAAQDILKNIFGGLVIVFDQPFQVGDKIQVGSSYGEVVSIGLRSTRIVTPDDSLVTVPNSQVVDTQVSNANSGALDCQVVTDLYLPGFVDESKAKRIAHQAAASSKYVYLRKPIVVLVKDEFKETFITHIKVKAYVVDARYEFAFMSDVTERARAEFRQEGLVRPMHGTRAWVDLTAAGHADGDGHALADSGES